MCVPILFDKVLCANCNYETFTFANIIFSSIFVYSIFFRFLFFFGKKVSLANIDCQQNPADWNKNASKICNSLNFGDYSQSDQCSQNICSVFPFFISCSFYFAPGNLFFHFRRQIGWRSVFCCCWLASWLARWWVGGSFRFQCTWMKPQKEKKSNPFDLFACWPFHHSIKKRVRVCMDVLFSLSLSHALVLSSSPLSVIWFAQYSVDV